MTTHSCELCSSVSSVTHYELAQALAGHSHSAMLCGVCREQLQLFEENQPLDAHHWHVLNTSIWSENDAVKVLAWRLLNRLASESWAQDLLDQLYIDGDLLEFAKAGLPAAQEKGEAAAVTKDSNGAVLNDGDAVTLIKDLEVKGANFTAKRGTVVRKITLTDDPALVEGKVNGTQIVLKTCFLKKSV